jgi:hypothetical protein
MISFDSPLFLKSSAALPLSFDLSFTSINCFSKNAKPSDVEEFEI